MATISVPLSPKLQENLDKLVLDEGVSRADIVRRSIEKYLEDKAVSDILRSQKEPTLRGDLHDLLTKID